MFHQIMLSKDFPSIEINVNTEKPFFKVTGLTLLNKKLSDVLESRLSIEYEVIIGDDSKKPGSILTNFSSIANPRGNINHFKLNKNVEEVFYNNAKIIKVFITNPDNEDIQMLLDYESIDLCVSMDKPFEDFDKYLQEKGNAKILFSAPFGQGKTTFLKYFFNNKRDSYVCFHLFPVNYSVASNEDIFRYIKCEILFQLLKQDIEFEREKFSYLQELPSFIFKESHNILAPFIKLLPGIGKSVFEIYEKLYALSQCFFKQHDDRQIDDKAKAEEFLKKVYEKEGSIYEDNFYTQLIRQLVTQLKEKGKETVLIIDNMDRIDPEHIFRILNVLAAHFDSSEYETEQCFNKFNFDKIIIVSDYLNLKEIYIHRYGNKSGFEGYINKFFSKNIYYYDNKLAMLDLFYITYRKYSYDFDGIHIFWRIIQDLIYTENLSLREMLKIRVLDENLIRVGLSENESYLPIRLLNTIIDTESIIERFRKCKEDITESGDNRKYHTYSLNSIIALASKKSNNVWKCIPI